MENRIGGVRLFPNDQNYTLHIWNMASLFEITELLKMPVMIEGKPNEGSIDIYFDSIVDLARSFRNTPVIISDLKLQYLRVPVVKRTEKKTINEISNERGNLVRKAINGTFQLADMEEGTFTISNLGTYGVDNFTAIINPPQSAILAVGSTSKKLVVGDEDEIRISSMMKVTLSADHRAVDGVRAAEFLDKFKKELKKY